MPVGIPIERRRLPHQCAHWFAMTVCFLFFGAYYPQEGMKMKENEKKPTPWECKDPKPPVVQSGHMENRIHHKQ